MELYIFCFFVLLLLGGLSIVSFSKNLLYAVFGLLIVFLCLVTIYVFLGADFVAVAQLMIYVGGILVLLVFGVMLSNRTEGVEKIIAENRSKLLSGVIAISVGLFFTQQIIQTDFKQKVLNLPSKSTIQPIAISLFTDYLFAFELAGILLLVGLVGASMIAGKNNES
ncbi:MAG: NADH-quinone oxidoreductase subunit J [Raineya sp.]|jgi:NADH:ubiquinone oxidoreductase subunit 6 (subunit J)|nr:NADH-quinone oxidoreductase subunit J [Raineya sp.]